MPENVVAEAVVNGGSSILTSQWHPGHGKQSGGRAQFGGQFTGTCAVNKKSKGSVTGMAYDQEGMTSGVGVLFTHINALMSRKRVDAGRISRCFPAST